MRKEEKKDRGRSRAPGEAWAVLGKGKGREASGPQRVKVESVGGRAEKA